MADEPAVYELSISQSIINVPTEAHSSSPGSYTCLHHFTPLMYRKKPEIGSHFTRNPNPACIFWHFLRPVWNHHEPRGSCNLLENRAHMVASVPALTCHVTAVMGLSMAAQTTVSQELVSCGSWGRAGRGWGGNEVPWSGARSEILIGSGVKESALRCTSSRVAWIWAILRRID